MATPQVSADLVWEVVRSQNSFLVKRKSSGGVQFSRDPLNLINKHSRKYAGFVNDKAIGVVPAEKGAVKVLSKKVEASQKPAKSITETTYSGGKSARKSVLPIVSHTSHIRRSCCQERLPCRPPRGCRRSRSAIRHSYKETKPTPEPKLRGSKAKKAAE
ncbi:hypothetical protein ONZ43_g6450 [Nemania bipapillata]|uniref:Uncharacterized protein n=1 Tax=Nemania bipapillata TaxID=110536 RepID=A0ACC2I031_9PEZI|nr:hypothetical protein ONZ43_g6450 [Nemania bipapillata]